MSGSPFYQEFLIPIPEIEVRVRGLGGGWQRLGGHAEVVWNARGLDIFIDIYLPCLPLTESWRLCAYIVGGWTLHDSSKERRARG